MSGEIIHRNQIPGYSVFHLQNRLVLVTTSPERRALANQQYTPFAPVEIWGKSVVSEGVHPAVFQMDSSTDPPFVVKAAMNKLECGVRMLDLLHKKGFPKSKGLVFVDSAWVLTSAKKEGRLTVFSKHNERPVAIDQIVDALLEGANNHERLCSEAAIACFKQGAEPTIYLSRLSVGWVSKSVGLRSRGKLRNLIRQGPGVTIEALLGISNLLIPREGPRYKYEIQRLSGGPLHGNEAQLWGRLFMSNAPTTTLRQLAVGMIPKDISMGSPYSNSQTF